MSLFLTNMNCFQVWTPQHLPTGKPVKTHKMAHFNHFICRSLMLQKRLMKRTQPATNTLSGYIGSSTSDRSERSTDSQSVKSDTNNSDNSDKKSVSGNSSTSTRPVKSCPHCKKVFTKVIFFIP